MLIIDISADLLLYLCLLRLVNCGSIALFGDDSFIFFIQFHHLLLATCIFISTMPVHLKDHNITSYIHRQHGLVNGLIFGLNDRGDLYFGELLSRRWKFHLTVMALQYINVFQRRSILWSCTYWFSSTRWQKSIKYADIYSKLPSSCHLLIRFLKLISKQWPIYSTDMEQQCVSSHLIDRKSIINIPQPFHNMHRPIQ